MDELRNLYSKFSDNELLIMVYFESLDYTQPAIEMAKTILVERGLESPSEELLKQANDYRIQLKENLEDRADIFKDKKLEKAIKKRDYYFIGKWVFGFIIACGIYSGLVSDGSKWNDFARGELSYMGLSFMETTFWIAILGIFPIIFFIIYSLKLSPEQRKERGLSLFVPKYILFIYGISLLIFIAFLKLVV